MYAYVYVYIYICVRVRVHVRVRVCVCGVCVCVWGVCVCVYTVITNGFSSVYCACTIPKKQGAEVPMSLPLPTKLGDMW